MLDKSSFEKKGDYIGCDQIINFIFKDNIKFLIETALGLDVALILSVITKKCKSQQYLKYLTIGGMEILTSNLKSTKNEEEILMILGSIETLLEEGINISGGNLSNKSSLASKKFEEANGFAIVENLITQEFTEETIITCQKFIDKFSKKEGI